MMSRKGKLIVFEGVDAAGKTTLCNQLYDSMLAENKSVKQFHFPGKKHGTLGELVYKIHHSYRLEFGVNSINPCSMQLLHIAAHVDSIESEIKPAINNGVWVILDRFWWSTYVYGLDSGVHEIQLKNMIDVEKKAWEPISPDIIFLIDSHSPLRNDEINSSAWQRKRQLYNQLATRQDNIQNLVCLENNVGEKAMQQALSRIKESIKII